MSNFNSSQYIESRFVGQKTNSEYPLARAFALMWFDINGFSVAANSSARYIARRLGLQCKGPKQGHAKSAIVEWHKSALSGSKDKPVEVVNFYSTQAWRAARFAALKRCDGRCQLCGARAGKYALHVDHIKPRSLYPARALDPENLQVLCRDCNLGKSNKDVTDWR